MATTRTPLMAGNWKMNLNHQEAVVLVQKLAWTLADKKHDYAQGRGRRAAAVHRPPLGADARRRRPAVDRGTAPRTSPTHDAGAYTGEISAAMLAKLGCSYVVRRPLRAARVPRRDRRARQRQGPQAARRPA